MSRAARIAILCAAIAAFALAGASAAGKAKGAKPSRAATGAEGGYVRVVNTGASANSYRFSLRFHAAPWAMRDLAFDGKRMAAPGEATPWVRLPDFANRNPLTVQVYGDRRLGASTGRVEFAARPSDDAPPLRTLDLIGRLLTVECERAAFTNAAQLRTDEEIATETLRSVRAMTFKGTPPVRFPTGSASGHEKELEAGRVLGFTALHGTPRSLDRGTFERLGYRYIFTYTHWLGMWPQGGGGYRRDRNDEHARELAAQWREAGLLDRIYSISVRDEAGLDVGKSLFGHGMEKDTNYWPQVIAAAGLTPDAFIDPNDPPPRGIGPESLEYWAKLRGFAAAERATNRLGVYNTMKVAQSIWPLRFRNIRESLRREFGERVLTTANIHMSAYFRDNLSGIDPWLVYSRDRALDSPQVCDYLVGWPQHEEWLIDLQRCAARPHTNSPVDAMLQAQEAYMPRPPAHLKLCAMSALGAGARSLNFYLWGPRYLATENWFDTNPERLRVIGEINHAAGWVEGILLDGAPRPARIAILYSHPSELWDRLAPADGIDKPSRYLAERRRLYHLLRGLHHQVDLIDDEVLPAEQGIDIDQYKVIFMSQRCITRKAADMLVDWVERGGTLVGVVSIGQLDELERPWGRMMKAFGLSSVTVRFSFGAAERPATEEPAPAAGAPLERGPDAIPPEEPADAAEAVAGDHTSGDVRHIREHGIVLRGTNSLHAAVTASVAVVTAHFEDGSPAILERALGRGRTIYVAWEPGDAYHRMSGEPTTLARELRLLTGMQESVRPLAAAWVQAAGPPSCATDHPLVSARLVESDKGSAVFLINSSGEPRLPSVTVSICGARGSSVESLERGRLKSELKDGVLTFALPMELTDVIRIY